MNTSVVILYLINRGDMRFLVLIFNRIYFILQKIGNQSPFLGAVILVSILASLIVIDIQLFVFSFNSKILKLQSIGTYLTIAMLFILLYFFAKKKQKQIVDIDTLVHYTKNILVIVIYIIAIVGFVFLSNVNRKKIFKERRDIPLIKNNENHSLESRVKKWLSE